MSTELDQFREVFFVESLEALDTMEIALLRLSPGDAAPDIINTVFRAAHSIKGGAGMFGFVEIASFTHTLETLLDELRAERMEVTKQICESLLESVDQIRMMIAATRDAAPQHPSALQDQIRQIVAAGSKAAEKSHSDNFAAVRVIKRSGSTQDVHTAESGGGPHRVARWRIRLQPQPAMPASGAEPLAIFEALVGLGQLEVSADCSQIPALGDLDPARCHIQWELLLASSAPLEEIRRILARAAGFEVSVEEVAIPPRASPQAGTLEVMSLQPARAEVSIRVAIEKIDEVLNAVGEIVITQSMLSQVASRLEGAQAERLRSGLGQLAANIRVLQESVMRVRMLPVGSVFSRFPRLVHDLSNRLGKQVRLRISGEQTELDKIALEKIRDPLVHLVRNSVDHGIETPDIRLAAGKDAEGIVHLDAFHKDGAIHIVITDDGRGLDKSRLLAEAQSRGLIDAGTELTDQQIYDLIFLPGFTTATRTTDVSGRGVGMDVVCQNITELGGSVALSTELGKGTTTTITLPLKLGIIDGQAMAVGAETYIVPLACIVASLQLEADAVRQIHNQGEAFTFRGERLPIIRLHTIFGVIPRTALLGEGPIVVVEADGRRAGLFIDALLGRQQVVIKSMEVTCAHIEGVDGLTVLGDGTAALILDIPALLRMAGPAHLLRTGTGLA